MKEPAFNESLADALNEFINDAKKQKKRKQIKRTVETMKRSLRNVPHLNVTGEEATTAYKLPIVLGGSGLRGFKTVTIYV